MDNCFDTCEKLLKHFLKLNSTKDIRFLQNFNFKNFKTKNYMVHAQNTGI